MPHRLVECGYADKLYFNGDCDCPHIRSTLHRYHRQLAPVYNQKIQAIKQTKNKKLKKVS